MDGIQESFIDLRTGVENTMKNMVKLLDNFKMVPVESRKKELDKIK